MTAATTPVAECELATKHKRTRNGTAAWHTSKAAADISVSTVLGRTRRQCVDHGDLCTVLDHFGAAKAHLVGESSSGQFLFAFALAHPERVASLTLCETTPRMQQWVFDAYRLDTESPPAAIRKYGTGEWCRRTLAYRLDKDHASPELSRWLVELMSRTPSHVAAAMIECFFGIDNHPLLDKITVPVLQLTGSEKTATNVDEQKMIHGKLPRSRLKIFEGYRGMIHLFEAERCAREAAAFWDDVDCGREIA